MENKTQKIGTVQWLIQRLKAIPAGMMLLPLLFGSLLHAFFPQLLEIGSYTTALFCSAGAATLMALQLFCIGTQIRLKQVSGIFRRGGVLLIARAVAGILAAILFRMFAQNGFLAGISVLAAVAAVSNTNGSIFIATTSMLGDEQAAAAAPILALSNGPMLTALILGASGAANFSWISFLALVLPMLLGVLIGNISKRAAQMFAPGVALTLPFIGFTLGAGIDLRQLYLGGISGLLLACMALLLGGAIAYAMDRLFNRGGGAAGIAASATGANAIAVPAAIALTNPAWAPYSAAATAQISVAVILGAIFVPLVAGWIEKTNRKKTQVGFEK